MERACHKCGFRNCRCGTLGPCDICREPIQKADTLGSYAGKWVHHYCALTVLGLDEAKAKNQAKDDARALA